MAWILYGIGFLVVATSDDPASSERPLLARFLIAMVWPLGAVGMVIWRLARAMRRG
jgi:hypothetical protein